MTVKEIIRKSLIAGALIGLSCEILSKTENRIAGACLFGIALLTICEFKLSLFTGRVGEEHHPNLLLTLGFNAAGVLGIKYILQIPMLGLGVGCGMLMQIAVAMYRRLPIVTGMCVAAFILSGFKHSIAMLYSPVDWSWLAIVAGNVIGAKLVAPEVRRAP